MSGQKMSRPSSTWCWLTSWYEAATLPSLREGRVSAPLYRHRAVRAEGQLRSDQEGSRMPTAQKIAIIALFVGGSLSILGILIRVFIG